MENVGSIKFNTPELWQALCNACSSPPSSLLIVTSQSHTSTPVPRTHAPFSPEWERFNGIRGINSENFREVLLQKMNARNSTRASTTNSGTDH